MANPMRREQPQLGDALVSLRLAPEVVELLTSLLDDYGEQKQLADILGISRAELVALVEEMIRESAHDSPVRSMARRISRRGKVFQPIDKLSRPSQLP